MNDFRKYATKHLGMNGMVLDDVMNAQAKYLNPYILEVLRLMIIQPIRFRHSCFIWTL